MNFEKTVVHTRTQEEFDLVAKICKKKLNKTFKTSYKLNELYNIRKEKTCINISCFEFLVPVGIDYYSGKGYNIISTQEFQDYFKVDESSLKDDQSTKVVSDGLSTSYYQIKLTNKAGQTIDVEMGDIIRSVVNNDFDLGNIMKACRRVSEAKQGRGKKDVPISYDCNKIKYFADEFEYWSR